ncbi:MAG TPA: ABC transporter permease [Gemmatimonadales bacterium]|nr:ABC transporter permease [Gemmatimonadales bacterium]
MSLNWREVRQAARALARTPGFTLVALSTLALGIGASTAIFTVVQTVLLRELPFDHPAELVQVGHLRASRGPVFGGFSPQDFEDVRAASGTLTSLSSYFYTPGLGTRNLTGLGEPLNVAAVMADGRLFGTLGVSAVQGRTFDAADDVPGANQVVVLSDGFWRTHFGADPAAVGRTVQMDGQTFRIIGVMPPDFAFPSAEAQVWLPLSLVTDNDVPHLRQVRWLDTVGRLAAGVTPEEAAAQVSGAMARLARDFPESNTDWDRASVRPLADQLIGNVRAPLMALMAAVGVVFLIAVVNVAHLMLARGLGRVRELSIRAALGATRARLVGHLLLESAVLATVGSALGLLVAWLATPLLTSIAAGTLPRATEIAIDPVVAGYAVLAGVVAFLIVGILPALRSAEPTADASIREGRGQTGAGHRLASGLLAAESGFAVLLLCGTVLTLSSLWKLTHVDPGFSADQVASFRLVLQGGRYETRAYSEAFRRALRERVAQIPGVQAVGGGKRAPLTGGGEPYSLRVVRNGGVTDTITPAAGMFMVTPGYFDALSIPMLAGREFTAADTTREIIPMVVSEALADQVWPEQDAVGQRFQIGGSDAVVIGVAGDVRQQSLQDPAVSMAYLPLGVFPRSAFNGFVRVAGSPLGYLAAIRAAVRELDPDLPVSDLGPLTSQIESSVARPRLFTALVAMFGTTALLLASLGVYGVVAQGVARRRREIGIRMVLGARAASVIRMVVSDAMRAAVVGAGAGLVAFLAVSRVLRSQLYQVQPTDPMALTLAAAGLLGTAWLAAWLPARRAASIDPGDALRSE